ncbi:ATP-binding protein [Ohessyouella blattaphilus]|uniref:GHKL domain-containing protein n=1 Tax=Ohessyouella blattaphilus TaxID=2949333 RepID=A0ABT1EJQ9_9FIRM|nr:sensor histidine kinase [Ohessyouella blattaphilus]MCP1110925.1 GHKL domain-containing protein [Ohessyouella blattaphilus]MCR8564319.1 GHKL domain-containing protein [Ohessyouella blattaphilus]
MMEQMFPDIPRLYTAIAEWIACVIYIIPLKKKLKGMRLILVLAGMLGLQCLVQGIAGRMPIAFWVPGMILAMVFMYLNIYCCCDLSLLDTGYCCARAFITAEFAASLGWQLYCFFFLGRTMDNRVVPVMVMGLTYAAVFFMIYLLESKRILRNVRLGVSGKELISAVLIAAAAFIISNVYFAVQTTVFQGQTGAALFFIRTVVDFSGLTMLYAQQEQRNEIRLRREVEALDQVLNRQYEQYQQSKGNIELLNRKYHDLKHQIAIIRSEEDPEKKESYLVEMDHAIKIYESNNNTGNKVLDVVLTGKNMYCVEHHINLTCVIDGQQLAFMKAMDICSIFGNALDNAIESVMKLKEQEKRLIRVAVYSQNNLLMMRFENYIEEVPAFEEGLPATTKKNKDFHGYGIKSIKHTAEKYGGNLTIHTEDNWFVLRVLIPRWDKKMTGYPQKMTV